MRDQSARRARRADDPAEPDEHVCTIPLDTDDGACVICQQPVGHQRRIREPPDEVRGRNQPGEDR